VTFRMRSELVRKGTAKPGRTARTVYGDEEDETP